MKILIVEDDHRLAKSMLEILSANHLVELALTGMEAMEVIESERFELIILDLHLPDMPGLDICKKIRKAGHQMPILVVTGETNPGSVVSLLDAGADDFLSKPFRVDELKARIRALGRRYTSHKPTPRHIQVGDFALNCDTHTLVRHGHEIYLRNKEFIMLEQLMLHPNIVMSRATLLDKAWDNTEDVWTNLIDVHIKYLRDKVDKPFGSNHIQTVHGLGYKFVPSSE